MIATPQPQRTSAGRFMRSFDELFAIWSAAAAEANIAFDGWRSAPCADSYAVFLAAEDRASAAQDALASHPG